MPLKKLSKTKLSVLIFSFSILCLTLAFFLSGLTWKQIVDAFAFKTANSTLTVNDWNGLMNDFVKKSGDTMTGGLTISNGSLNVSNGNINASGKITAGGQITASKICMGGNCRSSWSSTESGQCIIEGRGTLEGVGQAGKSINKPSCPSSYPYLKLNVSLRVFHGVGDVNYDDWIGVHYKDVGNHWQVQAGDCDVCTYSAANNWFYGSEWGQGSVTYTIYCCKTN